MPAGIITRFITRTHELIDGDNYWRNGVVLAFENSRALIKAEPLNRRIAIAVTGEDRRGLLTLIRREFTHIHKTLNNPDFKQMVPCDCAKCADGEPFFYEFDRLRKYHAHNVSWVICDNSIQRVPVARLLTGVTSDAEIDSTKTGGGLNIYVQQQQYYEESGGRIAVKADPIDKPSNPWLAGGFYLLAFVVSISAVAAIASFVSYWILPIVVVTGTLALVIIGALQLKQDKRLSDARFIDLMTLALAQLPLVGKLLRNSAPATPQVARRKR
jgi:hypothetical protein